MLIVADLLPADATMKVREMIGDAIGGRIGACFELTRDVCIEEDNPSVGRRCANVRARFEQSGRAAGGTAAATPVRIEAASSS